jgi:hypothetical protein
MTDKWADHVISAVRYNAADTHIERVRVHRDEGNRMGPAQEATRTEVVESIERGHTFATVVKGDDGKWHYGATVGIVVIRGVKYIRTDRDATPEDNLGRLPRF